MTTSPKNNVPKNPPPLPPGMDNPWYDYSPFPKRPRLAWPKRKPRSTGATIRPARGCTARPPRARTIRRCPASGPF